MSKPIFEELTPGYKVLFLFSFWLVGLVIFSLLSVQLADLLFNIELGTQDLSQIEEKDFWRYRGAHQLATVLNQAGIFALAAFSFFQLTEREGIGFSKLSVPLKPSIIWLSLGLGIAAVFGSMLIGQFSEWIFENTGTQEAVQQASENYTNIQNIVLSGGTESLLINLLVIGLLPGICEELFFRAGVQQYLGQMIAWSETRIKENDDNSLETVESAPEQLSVKGQWTAIVITSLLFAILHFEWEGFLTRFAMSLLLGWVFVRTGSLLSNVILHACYNVCGVFLLYAENQNTLPQWIQITPVIGVVITGVLIVLFRNETD